MSYSIESPAARFVLRIASMSTRDLRCVTDHVDDKDAAVLAAICARPEYVVDDWNLRDDMATVAFNLAASSEGRCLHASTTQALAAAVTAARALLVRDELEPAVFGRLYAPIAAIAPVTERSQSPRAECPP